MKWISNGDPPIYIREGDTWYNQKDKSLYILDLQRNGWVYEEKIFPFTKKTRLLTC